MHGYNDPNTYQTFNSCMEQFSKLNCAPGIGPGVLVIPGITNDCKVFNLACIIIYVYTQLYIANIHSQKSNTVNGERFAG